MKKLAFWILVLALSAPLAAQSLADVARQTKKEREGKKPAKVYTNQDLQSGKGNVSTSAVPQPPADDKAAAGGEAAEPPPTQDEINEEYQGKIVVKSREMQDLRRQKDVAQLNLTDARNAYMNESSGHYANSVLKPQWDEAKKRLDDLEAGYKKAEAELAALKEEARKKSVPAGLIRKAEEEGLAQPPPAPPKK
jgi:hypothetical protein